MKLQSVAWITFSMIALGYLIRMATQFDLIFRFPWKFLSSSLGTWALLFFFFMLARHSREEK